jgi:hypothetical protein
MLRHSNWLALQTKKSDVALSSYTPGGYVGQTSPLFGLSTSRAPAELGLPDVAHKPDYAPSSETPGGFVGQTPPAFCLESEVWPAKRSLSEHLARRRSLEARGVEPSA